MSLFTWIALLACLPSCAHTTRPTSRESEQRILFPQADPEPRKSYAELGYPRFGEIVARAGVVNGDGVPDFIVGDPAAWDTETPPMLWILSGKDGGVLSRFCPRKQAIGPRVDGGVDVDGDGVPDFLVTLVPHRSASDASGRQTSVPDREPVLCLVSGKNGSTLHSIPIRGDVWSRTDWFRFVGDFDHDGVRDFGVLDLVKNETDAALIIYSGRSGDEIVRLPIERECSRRYGGFVELGDVNRDGIADFAVVLGGDTNCPATLRLYSGAHRVPLWEHRTPSLPLVANAVLTVLGDMDGDGVNDFAVSWDEHVEVISGHAVPLLMCRPDYAKDDAEGYGAALAALGDINGDGVPDFAISDTEAGLFDGLVLAKSGKDGRTLWTVKGGFEPDVHHFGLQMAAIGDIDGDGITDLIVGCWNGMGGVPGLARVLSGANGSEIFELRRNGDDVVATRGDSSSIRKQ
jgi:hypothetical protein